jgi:hypothetical protein
VGPKINAKTTEILADGIVSPEEERELAEYASGFGLTLNYEPETERMFEIARQRWRISQGELPIVDCPIMLKRGETCHAWIDAHAFEERQRTVRVNSHGPSARIKIAKGVYYTVGTRSVSSQQQSYSHLIGSGHFVVTDKRLLFSSPTRSLAWAMDSIVDWDFYTDGVEIRRATGKPVTFHFIGDDPLILYILAAARGHHIG